MTDIRDQAQAEAERRYRAAGVARQLREDSFVDGAVWRDGLLPTREEIAAVLAEGYQSKYRPSERLPVNHHDLRAADAVITPAQNKLL